MKHPIDYYAPFRDALGRIVRDAEGQLVRQRPPEHAPENWPGAEQAWLGLGDGNRMKRRTTEH